MVTRLAAAYIQSAMISTASAAKQAASNKRVKYAALLNTFTFEPIAVEILGSFNSSTISLLQNIGQKISEASGVVDESVFLFQRICVLIQHFNAVLFHESLIPAVKLDMQQRTCVCF